MSASAIPGACAATSVRTRRALTTAAARRASGCLWMAGLVKVRVGHGVVGSLGHVPLLLTDSFGIS